MHIQDLNTPVLAWDPAVTAPRTALPPGGWDCHFHVFEDESGCPLAAARSYTPAPAPLVSYRQMLSTLGLARAVLVQPSVYGSDHRLYKQMLQAHGDWMRGVAVVRADTPDTELAELATLGTRGTRINALFAAGVPLDQIQTIARRVQPLNWHLQLCTDVDANPQLLPSIARLDLPIVVDHMGHLPVERAAHSAGFANLLDLLRDAQVWVKLSGPYRLTAARRGFEDCRALVDRLVQANPNQLVWGSDWPHPAIAAPMVNDTDLVTSLQDWIRDDALLRRILVTNPARLYGP